MANNQTPDRNNMKQDDRSKSSDNPGNFKNDPERASEAGRKGGETSQGGRPSQQNQE